MLEGHVFSNLVVLALLAGAFYVYRRVRESRLWREACVEVARRRPVSLLVVALFVLVALLDSVAWLDAAGGEASASVRKPRTLIDRAFPADWNERSYSAPFASVEFYGGAPLDHPGVHPLGTDIIGRDVLHLTLKGARVALLVGGLTTLIVIPLALLFGVSAGYRGGRWDDFVFFIISTLAAMPGLLLLIALIAALGRGPVQVCIALGVTGWVGLSRLTRGETLKLRELDYIKAARALGVSETRILFRHLIPNLMHIVIISAVLLFSGLVLSEAVLSWLGIGIDGSWGQMIDQARDELSRDPPVTWTVLSASTALFTLILAVNRLGDSARDVLDPRTARISG